MTSSLIIIAFQATHAFCIIYCWTVCKRYVNCRNEYQLGFNGILFLSDAFWLSCETFGRHIHVLSPIVQRMADEERRGRIDEVPV